MAISIVAPGGATPATAPVEGVTKAALALVGEAAGPFSPIPGPDSVCFFGGSVALERTHHVDLSAFGAEEGRVYEATDRDGHSWFVRRRYGFISAFRDRTDEELIRYIDDCNSMYRIDFSVDQVRAIRRLCFALVAMAQGLTPDKAPTRRERRWFKRRMVRLTDLQQELLLDRLVKMADVRPRLDELGILMPQVRH